jgi:hypothetical protein
VWKQEKQKTIKKDIDLPPHKHNTFNLTSERCDEGLVWLIRLDYICPTVYIYPIYSSLLYELKKRCGGLNKVNRIRPAERDGKPKTKNKKKSRGEVGVVARACGFISFT